VFGSVCVNVEHMIIIACVHGTCYTWLFIIGSKCNAHYILARRTSVKKSLVKSLTIEIHLAHPPQPRTAAGALKPEDVGKLGEASGSCSGFPGSRGAQVDKASPNYFRSKSGPILHPSATWRFRLCDS